MAPRKRNYTVLKIILSVIILALIAGSAWFVKLSLDLISAPADTLPTESILETGPEKGQEEEQEEEKEEEDSWLDDETEPLPTEPPQPVTASISAQGDLLIHGGIIKSCSLEGGYDFESNFRYLAPYLENYDWSIANLETTFGGDSNP